MRIKIIFRQEKVIIRKHYVCYIYYVFVLKIRKETRIQGLKSGCAIRSKNTDGSTTFVRIFTLPCLL